MLCVPCYVLLCHAHILEGLYDLISVESNRLLGIRFESIRQNFSPPCAFIRDLTSGKSSSAKRTSGESEVFDPRADSNRLCLKTIRLSLGVLDMSGPFRFQGEHCIRDFLEWLDTLTENDTRRVNVLAHNFQGYDGYFVIHQYHTDNRIVEQLRNGCKLLEVKHDRIGFIDSLSFFQMPLSAFPKTFGLTELKKGYFPHQFNIPEHQTYVGPVPAIDYYMPETMSPKARQAFEKWHQEQRDKEVVFDLQKELVTYCESDVRLLKEGCLTFKRLFEAKAGFNPFEHITIASACNRDLRMNRMIPDSIASEPVNGWRNRVNQSRVALEWLTWCDHQQRRQALEDHELMARADPDPPHPSLHHNVQHAGNAGEYRVPVVGFFVDGYCQDTNTIYEFHGCFWHARP